MRSAILSLVALFAASSVAAETSWIPFQLGGKVVFVEATINGAGPFRLIVDTGATETVLTPSVARRVGLKTWSATAEQRKGIVKEIMVGGAVVKDLRVFVFDPPQALSLRLDKGMDYGGMLGYTFLSGFATTLDYTAQRIRFDPIGRKATTGEPDDQGAPPLGSDASRTAPTATHTSPRPVSFMIRDQLIHVPGTINGRGPLTFLLDTGSAEVMVMPGTARRLGLPLVQGGGRAGTQAMFSTLDELAIGEVHVQGITAVVGRLGWERSSAITYDAIVGFPFFSNLVLTINYRDRTLLLQRGYPAR